MRPKHSTYCLCFSCMGEHFLVIWAYLTVVRMGNLAGQLLYKKEKEEF